MNKPRLYVIGDSISIQYGPYLEKYIAGRFAYGRKTAEAEARLNLPSPQGENGGDSSVVLAFLRGMVESGALAADLLLVNCGLHDIKTDPISGRKQVGIDYYRQNLTEIGGCPAGQSTPGLGAHHPLRRGGPQQQPGNDLSSFRRGLRRVQCNGG